MWVDPDRPNKGTPKDSQYVWRYNLGTKEIKPKPPLKIATKPANYYMLENKKGEPIYSGLENAIGRVENDFISVVRNKIEKAIKLTKEDRVVVSKFISLAVFRKPKQIEELTSFINSMLTEAVLPELMKRAVKKKYSTKEIMALCEEAKKETGRDVSIGEMKKAIRNVDKAHLKVELTKNKKLLTFVGGENIPRWASFINNHYWMFLEADHFITGDINHFGFFPLNPNICLVPMKDKPLNERIILTGGKLQEINNSILKSCDSFAIAKNRKILEALKLISI